MEEISYTDGSSKVQKIANTEALALAEHFAKRDRKKARKSARTRRRANIRDMETNVASSIAPSGWWIGLGEPLKDMPSADVDCNPAKYRRFVGTYGTYRDAMKFYAPGIIHTNRFHLFPTFSMCCEGSINWNRPKRKSPGP